MRPRMILTLFAMGTLCLLGWSTDCLAQASGQDVLNAAFVMPPGLRDTQRTRRVVQVTDTVQNRVGLHTFFAFDPSYSGGVRVATGNGQPDGDPVVTRSGEGSQVTVMEPPGTTQRSFFAYDPAFNGGERISSSSE